MKKLTLMSIFVWAGFLLLASVHPSYANDYDDQVAIERAAKQIYEADQAQKRAAERRANARDYPVERATKMESIVYGTIFWGGIALWIYIAIVRSKNRAVLAATKRKQLVEACFPNGSSTTPDISFDATSDKAIAIDRANSTMLYAAAPAAGQSPAEASTFTSADLLEVQLIGGTKVSVNTRSLKNPLIEFLFPQYNTAEAAQLHAKLLALKHQA